MEKEFIIQTKTGIIFHIHSTGSLFGEETMTCKQLNGPEEEVSRGETKVMGFTNPNLWGRIEFPPRSKYICLGLQMVHTPPNGSSSYMTSQIEKIFIKKDRKQKSGFRIFSPV